MAGRQEGKDEENKLEGWWSHEFMRLLETIKWPAIVGKYLAP